MQPREAFDVFGLPFGASEGEVKRKFREMAKRMHPDRGGKAEEFCALKEAYDLLTGGKACAACDLAKRVSRYTQPAPPCVIRPGSRIRIHSLSCKPALNGLIGEVIDYVSGTDRHVVRTKEGILSVRFVNLLQQVRVERAREKKAIGKIVDRKGDMLMVRKGGEKKEVPLDEVVLPENTTVRFPSPDSGTLGRVVGYKEEGDAYLISTETKTHEIERMKVYMW